MKKKIRRLGLSDIEQRLELLDECPIGRLSLSPEMLLHHVDRVSCDVRVELVRLLKVSSDLELGLVDDRLDLDRRTGTNVLLGELLEHLVVLLDRGHPSDVHDRLVGRRGLGRVVDLGLDDAQRGSDSERSVEDVDSDHDRVSTGKGLDDLQSTRPVRVSGGLLLLGVLDLLVVSGELVEQVVDDVGCEGER